MSDMLVKATEGSNDAYCFLLRNEFEILRRTSDSYLLHEHLEADNEPMYFHQFMEMADAHGLQFLAESYLLSTWISRRPGRLERGIRDLASDILELEQYTDFLRNRMFRKTLLCRKGIDLVESLTRASFSRCMLRSPLRPTERSVNVRDASISVKFSNEKGMI